MREAYITINEIPTQVMTWGSWIEESFTKKEVVICVTGNPGLPGFYTQFLSTIHSSISSDIPVWIVGHAGHGEPPETSLRKVQILKGNENKFGLNAQIEHKAEFIKTYVPDDVKIHLIGHSIGSYMLLELLKKPEIKKKVQHCYLIFPTFERMAISSNGRYYQKVIRQFWFIIRYFVLLFAMFPVFLQTIFITIYFYVKSMPNYFIGTALRCTQPNVLDKIVHLANDEMDMVRDADVEWIRQNKHLLKIHYGAKDGWVPLKYYRELKEKIPDLDAEINTLGTDHTFVLKGSVDMGRLVSQWINEYGNN